MRIVRLNDSSRLSFLKSDSFGSLAFKLIVILNSVWLTYQSAPYLIFGHDFSSYQLLAETVGPGRGAPYLTYFDIKPPFLIYSVAFWIYVFGKSVVSIFIFNVVVISGLFLASERLIAMASNARYSKFVSLIAIILIDSTNYLSSMFFNSESLGLLLTLIGLTILLSPGGVTWLRALVAGALFGAAFQTKEVYIFTAIIGGILCLVSPMKKSTRWKICSSYTLGGVASQLLIGAALYLEGALFSYIEVVNFKSIIFPFPNLETLLIRLEYLETEVRIYYLNLFVMLALALVISIYHRGRFTLGKSFFSSQSFRLNSIYLIFLILISIGFSWQGKPMFGHYAITVIFPMLIFIFSMAFSIIQVLKSFVIGRYKKLVLSLVAFVFLIAPAMSNFNVVNVNLEKANVTIQMVLALNSKTEFPNFDSEIASLSSPDECIQVAYGWGSATIYNYADRKPCTKYFIANLIIGSVAQTEMRSELVANPPKLIIYDVGGADLDIQSFEQNIFPYANVIESCYKKTSVSSIWVARTQPFVTRVCIKDLLNLTYDFQ